MTFDERRQKPSELSLGELRRMDNRHQSVFSLPDKGDLGVLRGQFTFRNHYGGLSFHGGRVTELQDMKAIFELPPGLSFNLVFEGSINFVLAGKEHQVGGQGLHPLVCSAIAVSRPEMITRHMKNGKRVYKLNLFVERSWLEARCRCREDIDNLARLFAVHARVTCWTPSEKAGRLAEALLEPDGGQGLIKNLYEEQRAVELLSICLEELEAQLTSTLSTAPETVRRDAHHAQLKQKVDHCLHRCESLQDIASALNMSASTLQRRFKQACGMTVIDYMRQRRLEGARSAMMQEGLSVGEAAYLAGYKYSSNFVTAFRKQFSITPSELMKSHFN